MKKLFCRFKLLPALALLSALAAVQAPPAVAEEGAANEPPAIELKFGSDAKAPRISATFGIIGAMTLLALLPAVLVMTTAFTRIVIVLGFLRHALSTQSTPPNMVVIGLSLFLTLFIMSPTLNRMNDEAIKPFMKNELEPAQALEKGLKPLREFMGQQTRKKDLALMLDLSKAKQPDSFDDVPTLTLIPAFALSELRTAFQMGFLLFLPFLIIDIVVSALLMSMGMVMVPPVMVSLPLKLLLFVMADGWHLVVKSLITSFAMGG